MLQARLEIDDWEVLSISLGKKLSCDIRGTLEIGVFVAITNDLLIILRGKGLQAVITGNEAEMDGTDLEVEGKSNGGNSALLNLKDSHFIWFNKLIIMVGVIGNFYWIKYWLNHFQISFFH